MNLISLKVVGGSLDQNEKVDTVVWVKMYSYTEVSDYSSWEISSTWRLRGTKNWVNPTDGFNWFFYGTDSVSPLYNKPILNLSDTIWEGIRYIRVALESKNGSENLKRIFYLSSHFSTEFIQLSTFIDKKYLGYNVVRTGFLVNYQLQTSHYYEQLRTRLSDTEIQIFKKWRENPKNCKLPVLNLHEGSQEFMNHFHSSEV